MRLCVETESKVNSLDISGFLQNVGSDEKYSTNGLFQKILQSLQV